MISERMCQKLEKAIGVYARVMILDYRRGIGIVGEVGGAMYWYKPTHYSGRVLSREIEDNAGMIAMGLKEKMKDED